MASILDIIRSMSGRPVMGGQSAPIYEPMVTTPSGVATGMGPVAPAGPRPQVQPRQPIYEPMTMNPMGAYTGMGNPYPAAPPPNPYLTNPQSGAAAMNDPNALTPALGGAQSNPFLMNPQSGAAAMNDPNALTPALTKGGGGARPANVPLPPQRPADLGGGSQPALYMVDFGDGSPVRSYLSKDGKIPEIPGANVFADPSYNPNAGALTKLIRGVF